MKPEIDFDAIVKDWDGLTAKALASRLINHDTHKTPVALGVHTAKAIGYPAARSRLPISNTALHTPYDPSDAQTFVNALKAQGKTQLVISYPTSTKYLDRLGTIDHKQELSRLGVGLIMKKLSDTAEASGMRVTHLPMVKLGEMNAVAGDAKPLLRPIRFWTHRQPRKDAAYVLTDDNVFAGSTFMAMLSHLKAHGVTQDTTPISIGTHMGVPPLTQNTVQSAFISRFRNEYPERAEKLDIALDVLGIGTMEALTRHEAMQLGVDPNFHAMLDQEHFATIAREFEYSIVGQLSEKNISKYPAVRESNASYVTQLSQLGLPIEPSATRR